MSLPVDSDRPTATDQSIVERVDTYLSYRVTLSHINVDKVKELVCKYAREYLIWPHRGDSEIPNPHFHIIIPTEDPKLADRLCKAFRTEFKLKGNGFHHCKWRDNAVHSAIAYCKHDTSGDPIYEGDYWAKLLVDTRSIADQLGDKKPVKRERLGEPVLTLSNILKQAAKYRKDKKIESRSLYCILHMMSLDGWSFSRDIYTKGVPEELYEQWALRLSENGFKDIYTTAKLQFLMPHKRSVDADKWRDVPIVLNRYND